MQKLADPSRSFKPPTRPCTAPNNPAAIGWNSAPRPGRQNPDATSPEAFVQVHIWEPKLRPPGWHAAHHVPHHLIQGAVDDIGRFGARVSQCRPTQAGR